MAEKTVLVRWYSIANLIANLRRRALKSVKVVQVRNLRRVLNPREQLLGRDNPDLDST